MSEELSSDPVELILQVIRKSNSQDWLFFNWIARYDPDVTHLYYKHNDTGLVLCLTFYGADSKSLILDGNKLKKIRYGHNDTTKLYAIPDSGLEHAIFKAFETSLNTIPRLSVVQNILVSNMTQWLNKK